MGKGHEQDNHERKINIDNKSMESCSTSPLIKEMQIRTVTRWTLSPFGLSNISKWILFFIVVFF